MNRLTHTTIESLVCQEHSWSPSPANLQSPQGRECQRVVMAVPRSKDKTEWKTRSIRDRDDLRSGAVVLPRVSRLLSERRARDERAVDDCSREIHLLCFGEEREERPPHPSEHALLFPEAEPSPMGDSGRRSRGIKISPATPAAEHHQDSG